MCSTDYTPANAPDVLSLVAFGTIPPVPYSINYGSLNLGDSNIAPLIFQGGAPVTSIQVYNFGNSVSDLYIGADD